MHIHTHPHGDLTLVAAAPEALAPVANALLRYVGAVIDEGHELEDGTVLAWWWWPLGIRREADRLQLLPPEGYGEDLATVLGLFSLQLALARRVGVDPLGHEPDQHIMVAPGSLEAEAIMLERAPLPAQGSTGWHVRIDGPLTGYPDDYQPIPLPELIEARPGLFTPLALPPGLLVRMQGDRVVSVMDAAKQERLA